MFTTRNFRESEFTELHLAEQGHAPTALVATVLPLVMMLAQWLRDLAEGPGVVASWWRSLTHNDAVGGAEHSEHLTGRAADVVYPTVGLRALILRVLGAVADGSAPQFGQLIFYKDQAHVHLSIPRTDGRENGVILYSPGKRADGTRLYERVRSAADVVDLGVPVATDAQVNAGFLHRGVGAAVPAPVGTEQPPPPREVSE